MNKFWITSGALLAPLLAAQPAAAQAISGEFTVQRFDPAPGPRNFITTRGARTDGNMALSAALVFNYAKDPLILVSCESQNNCDDPNAIRQKDVEVVQNAMSFDLLGSLTPIPQLQLGLRLPITRVAGQGITEQGTADPASLDTFGIGDPMLEAKIRLAEDPNADVVPGLAVSATGPLGKLTAEESYIGDDTPTVGGRLIIDFKSDRLSVAPNVGAVYRGTSRLGKTEVGAEVRWGLGVGYQPARVVDVFVDAFGAVGLPSGNRVNAAEIDLGGRFTPLGSPLGFLAGFGFGVTDDVGVPAWRIFLGVSFTLEHRDRDGDGIADSDDACPEEAESETDGDKDRDGCPGARAPKEEHGDPNETEGGDSSEGDSSGGDTGSGESSPSDTSGSESGGESEAPY